MLTLFRTYLKSFNSCYRISSHSPITSHRHQVSTIHKREATAEQATQFCQSPHNSVSIYTMPAVSWITVLQPTWKKSKAHLHITLKRKGLALSVLFVARDSHILLVNPHLLPRHPAEALPGTWGHSLWASFNYSEQWEYELRETESISSTYRLGRTSCWILCLMLHSWEASWRTDGCKLLSGSRGQGSEFRYAPVCSTWNE